MKKRVTAVAVVLGIGLAGITLAQPSGGQPNDRASGKARLRSQVIENLVEIDLLELEHEVAKAEILELTKEIRGTESQGPERLREMALSSIILSEDRKAFAKLVDKQGQEITLNDIDGAIKKTIDEFKASRDRKKKDYARQAAELADKRLELADLQTRYREAK